MITISWRPFKSKSMKLIGSIPIQTKIKPLKHSKINKINLQNKFTIKVLRNKIQLNYKDRDEVDLFREWIHFNFYSRINTNSMFLNHLLTTSLDEKKGKGRTKIRKSLLRSVNDSTQQPTFLTYLWLGQVPQVMS